MPDDASSERHALLTHYGAEVVLTPARKLMRGAVERAREIVARNPRGFMPHQFDNPADPEAHRTGTAREILRDTGGALDAFVAGVGTGGTITGVGSVLRRELPAVRVIAVEPLHPPVLGGCRHRRTRLSSDMIRLLNVAPLATIPGAGCPSASDPQNCDPGGGTNTNREGGCG